MGLQVAVEKEGAGVLYVVAECHPRGVAFGGRGGEAISVYASVSDI